MNLTKIVVSFLLCAVIFLWTTKTTNGYTSPYVHGKKPGNGKKVSGIDDNLCAIDCYICKYKNLLKLEKQDVKIITLN